MSTEAELLPPCLQGDQLLMRPYPFVLLALPLLLAACAGGTPASPGASTPQPGLEGFIGTVYSASDVSGIPDEPLPGQVVVALPVAAAPEILGQQPPLDAERLRFLSLNLDEQDPPLASAVSGEDGAYLLPLPPGDYVLCLGESAGLPGSFPIAVRGCGLASIAQGEARQVNISSGFGEILLEPFP
jgi:hypothetical protein